MSAMVVSGTHDSQLVALSIAVAIFASFTALSLASRIRASRRRTRRVWLSAAAVSLGGGIWSMHFVAMLAFSMPGMPMSYDVGLTLISLALAVGFTGGGFATVNWQRASPGRVTVAGLLIGTGVVAMHYIGMAAMRMPATLSYDWRWVVVSIIIALVAASAATWLASREQRLMMRLLAAIVMGAAIAGMHYSGMYAAAFTMASNVDQAKGASSIGQSYLAIGISCLTVFILLLSLGAAQLERVFERAARREARTALRLKIAEILRGEDTEDALSDTAALLGEHFGVVRAGFGDLDPDEDSFNYRACWTDGSVQPLIGRFPAAAFGVKIVAALNAGQTVVITDLLTATLSDEPQTHDTARDVETRAILVVPFIREGRLRTIVYLNDRNTREWRSDDVTFMEEVAERIRLVIERVAAEQQLRDLNASLEARVQERTRELQSAEAARRQADALYRAYFENTPDPLFVVAVSEEGRFLVEQINAAHEAGVGFKLEDIRGKPVDAFLPPDVVKRMLESYRRVVSTRELYRYHEVFSLSGETQHWDTSLVPLLSADGRVEKIIGTSRNVTAQVVAEEALRHSQKMEAMGQLTGGVAHDFNNLLTPIMGALDRLNRKGLSDDRDARLVAGAIQSAERARTLVQRLLSFARRQPLKPVPVDVAMLVTGMTELIASTIGAQIRIEVDAAPGTPPAVADPNQLEMALLNLSVNARDAMPQGGLLHISFAGVVVESDAAEPLAPGRYVRLCVADTGVGMDAETQKRAIEPFFSTKEVGRGTGLGLSMAHGLAAQLGGALTISSAVGEGTRICLWLPESAEVPGNPPRKRPVTTLPRGETALLVDDEDAVREATAQMLADLGFQVRPFSSAAEALDALDHDESLDLVVSDHVMPGMTGAHFLQAVRERRPALKVLLISGYAEKDGIDPTIPRLTKPFVATDLAAAITALIPKA